MTPEQVQIVQVERLLDAGATNRVVSTRRAWGIVGGRTNRDDRKRTSLALWLCACYDDNAPTWLIYGDDHELAWCTIPHGMDADNIVDADAIAGSHTSSTDILEWLSGAISLPGDYYGDHAIADRVLKCLLAKPS